uniref:Uncharacterized protein n=1 Tax=viral metagenome TaxID=1070528 RepID=A0A6C0EP19_9ZZZZ
MGGLFAKPAPAPKLSFTPDFSKATLTGEELMKQTAAFQAQAQNAAVTAAATARSSVGSFYTPIIILLSIVAFLSLVIVLYDAFAPDSWPNIFFNKSKGSPPSGGQVPASNILYIGYARYGTDNQTNYQDVTSYITSMVQNDSSLPSFTVGYANVGLATDPYPGKLKTLYVQYYIGTGGYTYIQGDDGTPFPQLPQTGVTAPADKGVQAPAPPILSKLYSSVFGNSSGDLAPSFHDATTSAIVPGNRAPLSAERDGGYGMQWWMYVKDWNYGYGKPKSVVKRPDSTNGAVMNPHISLHPTDNSLQVSVSVYPATEGGSGKAQPAPAGHSGSSDDVFVCEVPNIPLQTWFSVSVTVFGRNMDIYIDGKLVKSCFLSGVPKPSVGDIQLTPDGGFSGRICGFYHYPKMLTPADAMTFWQAGTSCKNKTTTGGSSATGYSVKFGVYDAVGKEIQQYAF